MELTVQQFEQFDNRLGQFDNLTIALSNLTIALSNLTIACRLLNKGNETLSARSLASSRISRVRSLLPRPGSSSGWSVCSWARRWSSRRSPASISRCCSRDNTCGRRPRLLVDMTPRIRGMLFIWFKTDPTNGTKIRISGRNLDFQPGGALLYVVAQYKGVSTQSKGVPAFHARRYNATVCLFMNINAPSAERVTRPCRNSMRHYCAIARNAADPTWSSW